MRNLTFLFTCLMISMVLTSCNIPGFQEGGWIPIVLAGLGFLIFAYKGIKSYNSGTISGGKDPGRPLEGKTIPWGFVFLAGGCLIVLIIYIWNNISNR